MEYVVNRYKIKINKICASCKNCFLDKYAVHHCMISDAKKVSNKETCSCWSMRDSLNNAGNGGGRVKPKEHLLNCLKYRQ